MAKKHTKRRNARIGLIIVVIILVLAVALTIALNSMKKQSPLTDRVLVTVNGKQITQAQIDGLYNRLPSNQQEPGAKEALLNQSIDEALLLEEASRGGIDVSQAEADTQFVLLLAQNQFTEEAFNQFAQNRNISVQDIKEDFRRQLIIYALVNTTIVSEAIVTDADVDAYAQQAGLFPENVTLSNQTRSQLRALIINEKVVQSVSILLRTLRAKASIVYVNKPN